MCNEIIEIYLSSRQKLFIKKYTSKYEKIGACYKHGANLNAIESELGINNDDRTLVDPNFNDLAKELIEIACNNCDDFIAYDGLTKNILLREIK